MLLLLHLEHWMLVLHLEHWMLVLHLLLLPLLLLLLLLLSLLVFLRLLPVALLLRLPRCLALPLLTLLLLLLLLLEGVKTSGLGSPSRDEGGRRLLLHRVGIHRRLVATRRVVDGNGVRLDLQSGRLGGSFMPLSLGASTSVDGRAGSG